MARPWPIAALTLGQGRYRHFLKRSTLERTIYNSTEKYNKGDNVKETTLRTFTDR